MNDELVTLLTERLFECTVTVHPSKSVIVDGIEKDGTVKLGGDKRKKRKK